MHVRGIAVCVVNRVVSVGETLRAALNSIAEVASSWLSSFAPDEWYEYYAHHIEEYHLPKGKEKRLALVETVGKDGRALLDAIFITPEASWLRHVPTVETLRRVWVQQVERVEDQLRFRSDENIPPSAIAL